MWRMFCAGFRHSASFHARVVLEGAACRLGGLGEVDDVLGILGVCCPDCGACSGVVVEGRVNEEDDVLVVRGKCESNKGWTDSFQAHKDVMQFLSRDAFHACQENVLRCMCSVYGCTVHPSSKVSGSARPPSWELSSCATSERTS